MTSLLVSVRSLAEAESAMRGDADVIDVKEPQRGPLGCALPSTWHAVADILPRATPLSIALGELDSLDPMQLDFLPSRCVWAKVGLAQAEQGDWRAKLAAVDEALPAGVALVPVAYADWREVGAPAPRDILEEAAVRGNVLLVDTFTKDGRSLFDWLEPVQVARLIRHCRTLAVQIALAGSLDASHLPALRRMAPDWIAVRGAVCRGDRNGTVDRELVRRLRAAMSPARAAPARLKAEG